MAKQQAGESKPTNKGEKQTIIFDKQIGGKRQSLDKTQKQANSQSSTNSAPQVDSQEITIELNLSQIRKWAGDAAIILLILASLFIAVYALLNIDGERVTEYGVESTEQEIVGEAQEQVDVPNSEEPDPNPQDSDDGQQTTEEQEQVSSVQILVTQALAFRPEKQRPTQLANTSLSGSVMTGDAIGEQNGGAFWTTKVYSYAANRGQGVTHLARQAMLDYLGDRNIIMSPQQYLFFETNLTQQSHPVWLNPGDVRTFSNDLLAQLTDQALALTDAQQANWNKYLAGYPLAH